MGADDVVVQEVVSGQGAGVIAEHLDAGDEGRLRHIIEADRPHGGRGADGRGAVWCVTHCARLGLAEFERPES